MRIASVKVSVLCVKPAKPYQAAGKTVAGFWHVLVEMTTTDKVVGLGYVVLLNEALVFSLARATHELGQHLIGMHVLEPEAAWEALVAKGGWYGPGGFLNIAIAPLDIALWDAAGKSVEQPLYRMLGGFCNRLPVYASDGFWYDQTPEQLAQTARQYVSQGYGAVKLRLGHESSAAAEVARVKAVRDAVGSSVKIMVDATETWDLATALDRGCALQDAGIHWLEDPIDTHNIKGYARLGRQLTVCIATGEHLYKVSDFLQLFETQSVGVALIDLGRIGGITPWRRVAALAHAHAIPVCGHVLPEVHVHLATAVPNGYFVEYVPRSAPILKHMPAFEQGQMVAGEAPGLGIELDRQAVARFLVSS